VAIIKKAGEETGFIETDVSKAANVQGMFKSAVDRYGRLYILWSNAGIVRPNAAVADILEED
jgi:NAD(P)-dependent dehydrogenase (short-subunit alcohol dehydrogenase family)